jgi:hypothetical protein
LLLLSAFSKVDKSTGYLVGVESGIKKPIGIHLKKFPDRITGQYFVSLLFYLTFLINEMGERMVSMMEDQKKQDQRHERRGSVQRGNLEEIVEEAPALQLKKLPHRSLKDSTTSERHTTNWSTAFSSIQNPQTTVHLPEEMRSRLRKRPAETSSGYADAREIFGMDLFKQLKFLCLLTIVIAA